MSTEIIMTLIFLTGFVVFAGLISIYLTMKVIKAGNSMIEMKYRAFQSLIWDIGFVQMIEQLESLDYDKIVINKGATIKSVSFYRKNESEPFITAEDTKVVRAMKKALELAKEKQPQKNHSTPKLLTQGEK